VRSSKINLLDKIIPRKKVEEKAKAIYYHKRIISPSRRRKCP